MLKTINLASPRRVPTMSAFPRSVSSIAVSVGGLAFFLIFASCFLMSFPISSTVQGLFYGYDSVEMQSTVRWDNETIMDTHRYGIDKNVSAHPSSEVPINSPSELVDSGTNGMGTEPVPLPPSSSNAAQEKEISSHVSPSSSNVALEEEISDHVSSNITDNAEVASPLSIGLENNSSVADSGLNTTSSTSSPLPEDVGTSKVDSGIYKSV